MKRRKEKYEWEAWKENEENKNERKDEKKEEKGEIRRMGDNKNDKEGRDYKERSKTRVLVPLYNKLCEILQKPYKLPSNY